MTQLILEFPKPEDFSADNFLSLPFNLAAIQAISSPHKTGGLVVYGAEGVGKTHLLHVWAAARQGVYLTPQNWPKTEDGFVALMETLTQGTKNWAVDDLQKLNPRQQEDFFHLMNAVKSVDGCFLVASNSPVSALKIMPEISSRLATFQQVMIEQPQGADLKKIMLKWAADRQWQLGENVVEYLLNHAGRSVLELAETFAKMDHKSLAQKRRITIPFVKEILG